MALLLVLRKGRMRKKPQRPLQKSGSQVSRAQALLELLSYWTDWPQHLTAAFSCLQSISGYYHSISSDGMSEKGEVQA